MRIPISQHEKYSKEFKALEKEIRGKWIKHLPSDVKVLLKAANSTYSQRAYESVIARLQVILESHEDECMRKPDEFRPYGPEELLGQGDLHLLDQMDGVKFIINLHKLLTGLLLIGPQGSGKSRFIRSLCKQITTISPAIKTLIIDPKNGFRSLPGFRHLDLETLSFDLKSPSNSNQQNFIFEFMPVLSSILSLVFGLNYINDAADIALSILQQYEKQTGKKAVLCLRDIFEALLTMKPKNFKEVGYHGSAKAGLTSVLGKNNLFDCRAGLPLEWLFSENTVINARSLTSETQCKTLFNYLLFWLYQQARNLPESKKIRLILIIDDSSRFIGIEHNYDAHRRTSQLGHMLAVLRATGVCVIFATQIASQIDPSALSLCRSMIVFGNVNGEENLKVVQNFMSLTPEQKNAILRFQTREALAFVSDSVWPYPVHGWTPFIEDMSNTNPQYVSCSNMITPWQSLTELSQNTSTTPSQGRPKESTPVTPKDAPKNVSDASVLKGALLQILQDCIVNPFDIVGIRAKRLNMSVRIYESHKDNLVQMGYLQPSFCGKAIYLIPTKKSYEELGFPYPYKRAASIEHAFYTNMSAYYLKQSGWKVQTEVPIGKKGQTIDVVAMDKSGNMHALEITLNTSNLMDNAAKLQDTAYQTITWLCRDAATAKAVKAYFNKCMTLPSELIKKFKYEFFSKWIKKFKIRRK